MTELPAPMPISKKGQRIYRSEGKFWKTLFLLPNRVEVHGLENKVEKGPCLIVSNHTGAAKDGAIAYSLFKRMLFYCAMYYIFDRRTLSREIRVNYLRLLVPARLPRAILNMLLTPIREPFAWYVSSRLREVGTLPVWTGHLSPGNNAPDHENIRETIQAYLLAGRAVVLMQADSVHRSVYHPYIGRFKKGAADVAHELLTGEHGLEVPVTPISIYGAEGLLTIGKRIVVRIGEPMTIRPFLGDPRPVEKFTAALEERVADLVRQDVEIYGLPKRKFQRYTRREI